MRKLVLVILAVALVAAIPAVIFAGHTTPSTATAHLHPANQSGAQGVINFTDDGTTLTVTGTATGLTGGEASLIYDTGSRPGGPLNPAFLGNCEPVTFALTFPQMFIGFWTAPGAGGVSTLVGQPISKTGAAYAALSAFDTVSIRVFAPGAANVLACGQVADHP